MKGERGIGVGATFAEVFLASTSSQLDEKVADLPYRRGPDQPSSSSLARRVRVQPLLLSLPLFVRYVRGHRRLDLFQGPWFLLWGRGEMADLWPDRFSLCLRAAVLSVCSLLSINVFSFPQCRLIIDPAGSVGPSGTGCDSDWKLVLGSAWLQLGPDTQLGGTPSVWSCLFPRVRRLLRSRPFFSPKPLKRPQSWSSHLAGAHERHAFEPQLWSS